MTGQTQQIIMAIVMWVVVFGGILLLIYKATKEKRKAIKRNERKFISWR